MCLWDYKSENKTAALLKHCCKSHIICEIFVSNKSERGDVL